MKPAEKSLLSSVSKSQKTRSIRKQRLLQRTLKKLSTLKKKCVKFETKSTPFEFCFSQNALNLRPSQRTLIKKITKSVIKVY